MSTRRTSRTARFPRGFSLIELSVAATIGGLILSGAGMTVKSLMEGSSSLYRGGAATEVFTQLERTALDAQFLEIAANESGGNFLACVTPAPAGATPGAFRDCVGGAQQDIILRNRANQVISGGAACYDIAGALSSGTSCAWTPRVVVSPICETNDGNPVASCTQADSFSVSVSLQPVPTYPWPKNRPQGFQSTSAASIRTATLARGILSWRGCAAGEMVNGTNDHGEPICVPMPPVNCAGGNNPTTNVKFGLNPGNATAGGIDCSAVDYEGACPPGFYASYVLNGAGQTKRDCRDVRAQIKSFVDIRVEQYFQARVSACPMGEIMVGFETDGTRRCRKPFYTSGTFNMTPSHTTNIVEAHLALYAGHRIVAATCGPANNFWQGGDDQYGLCNCYAAILPNDTTGDTVRFERMWYEKHPTFPSCRLNYLVIGFPLNN